MDKVIAFFLLCVAAFALVACSNQEPPPTSPIGETPSAVLSDTPEPEPDTASERERFITKADRMCTRILNKLRLLPQPNDLRSAATFTRKANRLNEVMLNRLRALTPPRFRKALSDDYAEAERLIALTSGEVIAALKSGDPARYQVIALKIQKATRKLNGSLRRFGFDACADSS
ncbi:MAG TPA: hypothetical protein VNP73_11860 [Actinomycetota bacterium]|nr:hypothetical protein [Actinomycetota bacterium]